MIIAVRKVPSFRQKTAAFMLSTCQTNPRAFEAYGEHQELSWKMGTTAPSGPRRRLDPTNRPVTMVEDVGFLGNPSDRTNPSEVASKHDFLAILRRDTQA